MDVIDGYNKYKGRTIEVKPVRKHKPYTHWRKIEYHTGRGWIVVCLLTFLDAHPEAEADIDFLLARL